MIIIVLVFALFDDPVVRVVTGCGGSGVAHNCEFPTWEAKMQKLPVTDWCIFCFSVWVFWRRKKSHDCKQSLFCCGNSAPGIIYYSDIKTCFHFTIHFASKLQREKNFSKCKYDVRLWGTGSKFIAYPVFHVCFSALCSFNTRLFPYFAKKFSRLWKSPGSHGMHSPQQLIYKPDENGKHWSQQHLYFSLALLLLDLTIKCMKCSEKAIWMTKGISVPTKLLLLRQIIEL